MGEKYIIRGPWKRTEAQFVDKTVVTLLDMMRNLKKSEFMTAIEKKNIIIKRIGSSSSPIQWPKILVEWTFLF